LPEEQRTESPCVCFYAESIHLIVASEDVAGFVRDFKKFTSKQLRADIEQNESHVMSLFVDNGGKYHFWASTNAPKKVESRNFYLQKVKYIHNNPVRKGYVLKPEYWLWSSANPEALRLLSRNRPKDT